MNSLKPLNFENRPPAEYHALKLKLNEEFHEKASLKPLKIEDRPPATYHALKLKLNEEFNEKAKIKGLVSYIYYPTCEVKTLGHAKLEIEGTAKGWIWGRTEVEASLPKLIQSAEKKLPFFRFLFDVTPNTLKKLKEDQSNETYISCSRGALKRLSKNGGYSVPFLMTLTPLFSSLYLHAAKYLGSKQIRKIEYYGDPNLYKYVSGPIGELYSLGYLSYFVASNILDFSQHIWPLMAES